MGSSEKRETFKRGDLAKGRAMPAWRNPRPKGGLPEEGAQAILDARPEQKPGEGFNFREHGQLMRDLAAEWHVSTTTVQRIWRRESWVHLRRKGSE